jgi:hypothetical protein
MNVVMKSQDRNLFGIVVRQSTNGSMLNLSDLQDAYDTARQKFGWGEKLTQHFFQSQENKERLYELLIEQGKVNCEISQFTKSIKNSPVKYLKALGVWKTTRQEGTFVDPYVWVSIALWMNPKIYAKVVIWLTDQLIFSRINAGIQYKPMTDAIKQYLEPALQGTAKQFVYANEANMINEIVFGCKGRDLRQSASQQQLHNIEILERINTNLIKQGMPLSNRRAFLLSV